MTAKVPTTVEFPRALPAWRAGSAWLVEVDGVTQKLSNLDKLYWVPEGYTKADLLAFYYNIAPWILPYVAERPLTQKRMPNGADGEFFYQKQTPAWAPEWIIRAPVVAADTGKQIDYALARDTASLLWLANLGCIELHPWHARVDDLSHPDYAFFDLDPMGAATFSDVCDVALLVRTVLDGLGLRGYPRTSGATGIQVYVPVERVHTAEQIRVWVGRACELINRADPKRTTMVWETRNRGDKVFLDHGMNTEGRNIAAVYCLRPERGAPVATPLRWEELETKLHPTDFTMASIWSRLDAVGDIFAPALAGGQDLRAAMRALGMDPDVGGEIGKHWVARPVTPDRVGLPPVSGGDPTQAGDGRPPALAEYERKRDFARTPEPAATASAEPGAARSRFVLQHHLATRLHHDLRLEHDGTAPSWALPKGLPEVRGLRHLAVQTEDHPIDYMSFEGEIPEGEYGGGPVRIWDSGTYEALEWADDKVTFRLDGGRHRGVWHLFRTNRDDPKQWLVTLREVTNPLPKAPPQFTPMLAAGGGEPFDDPAWLFEVKWDGVRALATVERPGHGPPASTTLTSRLGNDFTGGFPELADLWERVLARNAVLDGEILAFGPNGLPSFQALQSRLHLRGEAVDRARRTTPVTFMVFDLLAVDGEPLVDLPLSQRLERLERVFVPGKRFQRSDTVVGAGRALYQAVDERGMEGVIAKRADSVYRPGNRSPDWRKIKIRRTVRCVIGGWLPGDGARAGTFASLLVGLYDQGELRFIGQVGTGFNQAELQRVLALLQEHEVDTRPFADAPDLGPGPFGRKRPVSDPRWIEPNLVCQVEYGEVTEACRLRAPSYKGLLAGVEPRECLLDNLR